MAFAEALVRRDAGALERARSALREALGPDALVDAAAVASNFERMVRIADATGIPLDAPVDALSGDFRSQLGIDRFGSAANTPERGALLRTLGAPFRAAVPHLLRWLPRIPSWRRSDG